jgi:hypothetical protein
VVHEGPLTFDEAIKLRTDQLLERQNLPRQEVAPPVEEPEVEVEDDGDEDEPESISEEPEAETDDDEVLSKLNLDDMSEDELAALGKTLRSKLPKRIGKLTKRAKEAEERIAQLEAKLSEKQAENPLETKAPVENNPFSDIDTLEGLREQSDNFARITEWAEELLDEHEGESYDDYITEQDGKQLTKRDVKNYLKKARNARETFLPARLAEIQQAEQGKHIRTALAEKAKGELPWYGDADESTNKEYELVVNDPRIKLIRDRVPEVAPQLDYLLAHAVNSMAQAMGKKAAPKKASAKLTPPSNPSEAVTRSADRGDDRINKELKELTSRFEQTQSYDDFIALRAKQRLRKNR